MRVVKLTDDKNVVTLQIDIYIYILLILCLLLKQIYDVSKRTPMSITLQIYVVN
jgi:hypothetical protein